MCHGIDSNICCAHVVCHCVSLTCWWCQNRSDSGHSETAAATGAAAVSATTAHHLYHLCSSPSSLPKCNTYQPDSNAAGEAAHHEERVGLLTGYVTFYYWMCRYVKHYFVHLMFIGPYIIVIVEE